MEHRIAHSLSAEQARAAARETADDYAAKLSRYDVRVTWTDPDNATVSFRAAGKSLHASVRLEPGALVLGMDVPFLLRPLAGRATSVIDTHFKKVLERYQAG